ncbi:hypothetical protein ACFFMN_02680 [Planobispora siamensis]|uniref:Uncharacterized protein n=1 Tax=Planobispora siamensis TaxID=936338 RepID=A0A8J3WKS0_9ACTN|nr:hypothetical protein [Planobispora siamensis]GIH93063.1 hypothetical protein Psi01_36930 [Planobispora siamensis]
MPPAVEGPVLDVDLGPPGRAFRRRALVALAVAGALTAALCVWLLPDRGSGAPPVSGAGSSGSSGPSWVVLARPSGYHGDAGYPVGFPRTTLGAVSAAAAALEASWTLDAWRAEQAAELYAPAERRATARDDAGAVVRGWRETLDLPLDGDPPAGAALRTEPIGVRWNDSAGDEVLVSLLVRVNATRGTDEPGPAYSAPLAVNMQMIWRPGVRGGNGDWVRALDPPPAAAPPIAEPGTREFAAAGWKAVTGTPP